jgi:hypothetical protein
MAYSLLATLKESVRAVADAAEADELSSDALSLPVSRSADSEVYRVWDTSNRFLEDQGVMVEWPSISTATGVSVLAPVACDEVECGVPPQCFTDFEPRYLDMSSISHLVVGAEDPPPAPSGPRGEMTRGGTDAFPLSPLSSWNSSLAWTDIAAVAKIYSQPRTHYGDLKRVLISDGRQGSRLSIKVDLTINSVLWLCELNLGMAYGPEFGRLNTDASIYIKYYVKEEKLKDAAMAPENKLGEKLELTLKKDSECFTTTTLPGGLHVLTLVQAEASKRINLAYMVHW